MKLPVILSRIWFQATVLSLILLLTIGVLRIHQMQSIKKTTKPFVPTVSAPTIDESIQHAQQYLVTNINQVDPQQRLILDYLYRRFGIDKTLSAEVTPIDFKAKSSDAAHEYQSLERIAFPNKLVSSLGNSPSLLMQAANCDRIPLPKNYSQLLQADANNGGYSLTHAAFAVEVTRELGCKVILAQQIDEQARLEMIKLAADAATPADLRYEAVAFLAFTGHQADIKQEWVQTIRSEQQADGSWQPGAVPGIQIDHTTTLALWALLTQRSGNSNEPLIRR